MVGGIENNQSPAINQQVTPQTGAGQAERTGLNSNDASQARGLGNEDNGSGVVVNISQGGRNALAVENNGVQRPEAFGAGNEDQNQNQTRNTTGTQAAERVAQSSIDITA